MKRNQSAEERIEIAYILGLLFENILFDISILLVNVFCFARSLTEYINAYAVTFRCDIVSLWGMLVSQVFSIAYF